MAEYLQTTIDKFTFRVGRTGFIPPTVYGYLPSSPKAPTASESGLRIIDR